MTKALLVQPSSHPAHTRQSRPPPPPHHHHTQCSTPIQSIPLAGGMLVLPKWILLKAPFSRLCTLFTGPQERLKKLLESKDKKAMILEMAGNNEIDEDLLDLLKTNQANAQVAGAQQVMLCLCLPPLRPDVVVDAFI